MNCGFKCGNCHVIQPVILGVVQHFDSCGKCGCERYCSRECQVDHWKNGGHKEECSTFDPQSQKKLNRETDLHEKILMSIGDPARVKSWLALSTKKMKQTGKRGLFCVYFDTADEAETALATSSIKGGIWVYEGVEWLSTIQTANIRMYNPEHEFVVSSDIDGGACVTAIINVNKKLTDISHNPFNDGHPSNRVMLLMDDVAGDLTGKAARKKIADFVKNCFKAMGIYRTPPDKKEKLEAYVKDHIECYDCMLHNDTAFVFALGRKYQEFCDQKVFLLCQTFRRVIMLTPSAIDIKNVKTRWCINKDRRGDQTRVKK